MLIRIQKNDKRFDMVKPDLLEEYIQTGVIRGFNRASGWVVIGRDPIRGYSNATYIGPERRQG
ncbi:MAG: hypothetical protein GXY54_07350 [Deltaproteobacteria bacterium]|nr:hypothetical protein [Deltaproteobacteria bacterium]